MRDGLVVASCGLYLSMAAELLDSGQEFLDQSPLTSEITRVTDNSLRMCQEAFIKPIIRDLRCLWPSADPMSSTWLEFW